jgi:hypothetical protein
MEKINVYNRCVYTTHAGLCPGTSPLHPKEHYLPAGLGNFRGDLRLKNFICYDCQRRFSQYEEVFLRNGTEAFFRNMLGIGGRKSHGAKNIFIEPTLGLPPLTVKGVHPGLQHEMLWEMSSKGQAFLMHQLVFKKPDGSFIHIPIRRGKVRQDLSRYGDEWTSWQLAVCFACESQEEELQLVLGPHLEGMQNAPIETPDSKELEGEMRANITRPGLQAISKIAFHFVLAHFHFTGFEPEFADLKRFIYSGNGECPARIVEEPILADLIPDEAYLRLWTHILTAEFNKDGFFARMQFFVGPKLKPFVWRVRLGLNPSRILETQSMGFAFSYFEEPQSSGYLGSVRQLQIGPKMLAKL